MIEVLERNQYLISHGEVSFIVDADAGGRITSAQYGGKEVLLQHRNELINWGSTFWPAPQSNWNWPPPRAIFSDPYKVEIAGEALVLKSEVDPTYKLSARKEFQLNKQFNCLEVTYFLKNESDSVLAVGPWEITCVQGSGSKIFFMNGKVPEGTTNNFNLKETDGVAWIDYDQAELQEMQKHFNNSKGGWLAHISDHDLLFVKSFEVIADSELAPGQGNIEVYINSKLNYAELENHGKYQVLNPGEFLNYKVQWYLSPIDKDMHSKMPSDKLLDKVKSITTRY